MFARRLTLDQMFPAMFTRRHLVRNRCSRPCVRANLPRNKMFRAMCARRLGSPKTCSQPSVRVNPVGNGCFRPSVHADLPRNRSFRPCSRAHLPWNGSSRPCSRADLARTGVPDHVCVRTWPGIWERLMCACELTLPQKSGPECGSGHGRETGVAQMRQARLDA